MIATLLLIFTTLTAGSDLCELGKPADWTAYASLPTITEVAQFRDGVNDFDLLTDPVSGTVLFVYNVSATTYDDEGNAHGRCARRLD